MQQYEFDIDEEFLRLMFPRSEKHKKRLELDLTFGLEKAVVTLWHDCIIDGYDHYLIAKENNLPIEYKVLDYHCRDKVISWICERQAKRQDLPKETRWYCIGKCYEIERVDSPSAKVPPMAPMEERRRSEKSRSDFAMQYKVAVQTIYKYWAYAMALDYALESAPELVESILQGEICASQDDVATMIDFDVVELQQIYEHSVINKKPFHTFKNEHKIPRKPWRNPHHKSELPSVSVKNIPQYDPDAELSSMSLTIPSWISSINRVQKNLKIDEVSDDAIVRAFVALDDLVYQAEELQKALRGKRR